MRIKDWFALIGFIALSQAAGAIGSLFTFPSIPTWYASLAKPEIAPPNWVFGPVWTTLFLLMGIAAFLVWKHGWRNKRVKAALSIFAGQLVLNVLWSIMFFGFQAPGAALVEITFLWLAILWTIVSFAKISKPAALLLVPYLMWVSFASYLNLMLWMLN